MRILAIGDLHGKVPDLEEIDNYDLVLCVGDVCGTPEELREAGLEARGTEKQWFDFFGKEEALEIMENSIEEGRRVLKSLNDLDAPVLIVPGNADWTGIESDWEMMNRNRFEELVSEFESIQNLNEVSVESSGFCFIGYGPCPGPEPDAENAELEHHVSSAEKPVILLSHNVPNGSSLDGEDYGSRVVRRIVEKFSPVLSVGGHIHEGKGAEEIGYTTCVNTGMANAVEITVEDTEVKQLNFRKI